MLSMMPSHSRFISSTIGGMPHSQRTKHEIYYDTAGDSGPPVLLIMGFTMRGDAWRFQIEGLQHDHQVAWFDHAGLGDSGGIRHRVLTMRHLALDAMGVMDSLGWDSAHVVGISMGGMIAQNLALMLPHRVRSLTLAATHPGGPRHVLPPVAGLRAFAGSYRGSRDQRLDSLSRLLFGPDFRRADRHRARAILSMDFHKPPKIDVSMAQLGAIARHDTNAHLDLLGRHETLVVRPGRDVLIHPRGSDALASGIPGATMLRFDDAGHAVSRECPTQFNDAVAEHIERSERPGA